MVVAPAAPLLLLLALLAGSARAHAPSNHSYCDQLNQRHQGADTRDAVVSVFGRARGVALAWGAAPARAGAALLAALLAAALRYRARLAPAPHRLVQLAANTSLYRADADYNELLLVMAAAWAGERGAECNTSGEDECGVAGPRLRDFGAATIPAHARLHLRLPSPAAPAAAPAAACLHFLTDNTSLAECRFHAGVPVYYPDEESLRGVVGELRRRAAAVLPLPLPLRLLPLSRSELFHKLRSNQSFLFLDYDMWQGEPGVSPAAPPPCPRGPPEPGNSLSCRDELDPAVSLRAVDSNILTRYSPRLYDTFHRFHPPATALRSILRREAAGLPAEQAACQWALENNRSFDQLINETVHQVNPVVYEELVFLCKDDIYLDDYHRLIKKIYYSTIEPNTRSKNYIININVKNITCNDPKAAIATGDEIMASLEGKKVLGLVASGEGAELAAFAARRKLPLVLFEPVAGGAGGVDGGAAAWSSAGRLPPLALVARHLAAALRWTRLAVVSDPTPHAKDFFEALNDDARGLALRDFPVRENVSAAEARTLMETLRRENARIVLVNTRADVADRILSAAAEHGMMHAEYAWLVRDWPPGTNAPRVDVISISYWYRGDGYGTGTGSLALHKELSWLWPVEWPPRAVPLADALLTLAYCFDEMMRRQLYIIEYDLPTDELIAEFKSVMANGSAVRAGVLQELRYNESTRARQQPLVFVDWWSGGGRAALGHCRVEGARVECGPLRWPHHGRAPGDGAARCWARAGGDAFSPGCVDAAWMSVLAVSALAAPGAWLARRAVLRRLARRDRRLLLQLLARRERAASALATHLAPRAALELREELGAGRFGRVHLALLRASGRARVVAAKGLREGAAPAEESEFLREACTLAALEHEHVVRLVGVCADEGPPLVLMEHAFFGDLLRYLRARRHLAEAAADGAAEAEHVSAEALTRLAREAASALGYLALRGLVHRDVRAANCLVDARRSLKLADFGMARETAAAGADGAAEYACRRRALFPVLWMAPESLARGVFSAASDVWALGVLVLELVTLGGRPYGDMSPLRVLQFVAAGGRPPLPPDAAAQTRGVALACWQRTPEQRPSAAELVSYLAAHARALQPALQPPPPPPRLKPTDADSGYGEPSSPHLLPLDGCLEPLERASPR